MYTTCRRGSSIKCVVLPTGKHFGGWAGREARHTRVHHATHLLCLHRPAMCNTDNSVPAEITRVAFWAVTFRIPSIASYQRSVSTLSCLHTDVQRVPTVPTQLTCLRLVPRWFAIGDGGGSLVMRTQLLGKQPLRYDCLCCLRVGTSLQK